MQAFLDLLGAGRHKSSCSAIPGTTELRLMDDRDRGAVPLRAGVARMRRDRDGRRDAQASGKLAPSTCTARRVSAMRSGCCRRRESRSPLIVTAGQLDQEFNFTEPFLWGDLPVVARPLVDRRRRCAGSPTCRALSIEPRRLRSRRPPGPSSCRSRSTFDAEGSSTSAPHPRRDDRMPRRGRVRRCRRLAADAAHPVIIAGVAVAQNRAHAEFVALAELLGASVYTQPVPSSASFPASHPLFRVADNGTVWSAPRCARSCNSTTCCSRRRQILHPLDAVGTRPDARGRRDPSRQRSMGTRQKLSRRGRDLRHLSSTLADLAAALQARIGPALITNAPRRASRRISSDDDHLVAPRTKAQRRIAAAETPLLPHGGNRGTVLPEAVIVEKSV